MGRMKEACINIINANDGIPEGMTIADVARMKELEIYNWREYERQQEKARDQFNQSENSGEITKIEQVQKKFSKKYREAKDQGGEQ
jgi:rRNA maturation protein Rpf1